jgi:hypothetical protein
VEPDGPYLEAIQRAFQFAHEHGRRCGPAEFLIGISEGHGPAAAALTPGPGRTLPEVAAWRLAERLGLNDDQRYSLMRQHDDQVKRRATQARADLARPAVPTPRARRRRFANVTVGWAAWFSNRRVDLRDRWFRLRTTAHYRGCPQP